MNIQKKYNLCFQNLFKTNKITLKKVVLMFILCGFCSIHLSAQFKLPNVLKHTHLIQVQNIYALNSTFKETNICVSPNGQYLFFMSLRGGQSWSIPTEMKRGQVIKYDGDIWFSQKINNQWTNAKIVQGTINTNNGEDEPNISPDGQTIIFQSWSGDWKNKGGPYYQSSLNGTIWGNGIGLGGGINRFFIDLSNKDESDLLVLSGRKSTMGTDGATLSADGKTFIVAVGAYTGKMDLYISRKKDNIWSYPKRLPVSTLGNERSPFLAADGKTLYFASDGYGGWGGLDIHKTVINDDDTCQEVVNIGSPFNTWQDDYGFILTATGNEAYFVREGDIYFANTTKANPSLKPEFSTLMLTGKIMSKKNQKPTQAQIKIIDDNAEKVINEIKNNILTGEYIVVIPITTKNIRFEIEKLKYKKEIKEVEITSLTKGLNTINTDFYLITEEEQAAEIDKENAASFEEEKRTK
ncbi:MAG: hypothetical protein EAZ06_01325 [Cytophagales bacterium]|nr:MAG: hypothetical protein EAZ06_01325 [Cytophagales bacterium]